MTATQRNRSTLQYLKEADPGFITICEAIVIHRWRRFIADYIPADYAPNTGRSMTYPILRPADVDFMTSWDGICFSTPWDHRISEMVLNLIGEEVKAVEGLTLAWSAYANGDRQSRALLVFTSGYPVTARSFDRPFLIQP